MFRAWIQLQRGLAWTFVGEAPTSTDAWNLVTLYALALRGASLTFRHLNYYAAQVISPGYHAA